MLEESLVEAQEAINSAVNAADRASEVITRIRALLRNDKPEYLAVDINSVIRDVLRLTDSTLQGRKVLVRIRLPADLPQVRGDRIGLQQVIMNLITNGSDAMSSITDRSRILRIESQIEASGSVQVAVADAGTGFNRKAIGWPVLHRPADHARNLLQGGEHKIVITRFMGDVRAGEAEHDRKVVGEENTDAKVHASQSRGG